MENFDTLFNDNMSEILDLQLAFEGYVDVQ